MVTIESAWKKMVGAAISSQGGGAAGGAKDLIESSLGSKTEIPEPEYDLQQAKKFRGEQVSEDEERREAGAKR